MNISIENIDPTRCLFSFVIMAAVTASLLKMALLVEALDWQDAGPALLVTLLLCVATFGVLGGASAPVSVAISAAFGFWIGLGAQDLLLASWDPVRDRAEELEEMPPWRID